MQDSKSSTTLCLKLRRRQPEANSCKWRNVNYFARAVIIFNQFTSNAWNDHVTPHTPIFRLKIAAFWSHSQWSQVSAAQEWVNALQPAFFWSEGRTFILNTEVLQCSGCKEITFLSWCLTAAIHSFLLNWELFKTIGLRGPLKKY